MLGRFHLAMNFIGAVGNIMKNSGTVDIITKAKNRKQNIPQEIITNLLEPTISYMETLHIEAFENWYIENTQNKGDNHSCSFHSSHSKETFKYTSQ